MLDKFLNLQIKFSESHRVGPRIIIWVLAITGSWIIISYLMRLKRDNKKIEFNFKFFKENYDKIKFYGTLVLLFGYVYSLNLLGFLLATIIFMFVSTLFFFGSFKPKTLLISAISSLVTSFSVWYVFGTIFNITLP